MCLITNTAAFASFGKSFVSSSGRSLVAVTPTQLGYAIPESAIPVTPDNLTPVNAPSSTSSKSSSSALKELSGFEDLAQMIENAPEDQDTVVYFYANYCKKCKVAMPRYAKIAKLHNEGEQKVQFAKMESSRLVTKKLKRLGIDRFPLMQVWRNGERIASVAGASGFQQQLKDTISQAQTRTAEEWAAFREEHEHSIKESVQALWDVQQPLAAMSA